ncbi:hypothetical protein HMI01_26410 [Halolactibacillus miurensis]|uniref:Ribonuclease inhibitor n=1 Tax=Halolactibacillus miurensis TaxID=306541 RepID=A0A1I6T4G8_9BACI|nr:MULTISPECIES: barstar family protein [Halolactibacillus]GEM05653.1 hypothetical protein HMI01_26410 [Halolactibacillus miurensis]SFS84141.1 ribonuclease inhibitor [Halolactibacillus miurensis]
MTEIVLDGERIVTLGDVHREVTDVLKPNYYGANLDALWDVITSQKAVRVVIKHEALLQQHLGNDYQSLITLFNDAAKQVSINFSIVIIR